MSTVPVGSPYDAVVTTHHDLVAFFVLATIIMDIFVFYYIHRISLAKPYYKCCKAVFKPLYPNYYTLLEYRGSNVSSTGIQEDDNNNSMFSMHYGRIISTFLNNKHSFIEYCMLILQIWSFLCGLLAFYASLIFWLNLFLQFFVITTGADDYLCRLGLLSLYFILEVIFWFIRRQFESLVLMTRNNGDIFNLGLLPISRILNLFLCIICTLWIQFISDITGWKYFILFMLIRGFYHQLLYVVISLFATIYIVLSSMKKCKHFIKLICVVSTLIVDDEKTLNCCLRSKTKLLYIVFIWVLILMYSVINAIIGPDQKAYGLFEVCLIFIIFYYILIMFERGKYNSLYFLWRDKFSKQFFMSLPVTKSRVHTVEDMEAILKSKGIEPNTRRRMGTKTPELQIQMQPSKSDITEMANINLNGNSSKRSSKLKKSLTKSHSKSSTKFSMIQDQSDDDSDDENDGILTSRHNNINKNGHQSSASSESEEDTVMMKLSPHSDDNDDIAGVSHFNSNTNNKGYEQASMLDDIEETNNLNDNREMDKDDGSSPKDNNRASSNLALSSIVPTIIDYRQYWDRVSFSEERRCKCFTLCTGECNRICCKDYCIGCCCNKDGCKWCFTIWIIILLIFGTTGVAHSWMLFDSYSYDINDYDDDRQSYPICDLKYNQYLNVIDLVYLSISAHEDTDDLVNDHLKIWFGDNYEIDQDGWILDAHFTDSNPQFYHIYNLQYHIDVVGVRSNPNGGELLLDIGLWSEVSMVQIFSWVIPLDSILPKAWIVQFVRYISIFEDIAAPYIRDSFDKPVYRYIKENILENPKYLHLRTDNDTLFIVGHGIGGGVAEIVAAQLYDEGYGDNSASGNNINILSFGVSTPGTVYSSGKFGFTVESLDKSSISILPSRDVISSIDKHGGFIQNIECTAQENENCHSSVTTFCELYDECSNDFIRNMEFVECVCVDKNQWSDCK